MKWICIRNHFNQLVPDAVYNYTVGDIVDYNLEEGKMIAQLMDDYVIALHRGDARLADNLKIELNKIREQFLKVSKIWPEYIESDFIPLAEYRQKRIEDLLNDL